MNVVIRADSGMEIGTGHLMRCLTLATSLKERGDSVLFVTKSHLGNIAYKIEAADFDLVMLPVTNTDDERLTHSAWLGSLQHEDAETTISIIKERYGLVVDLVIVDHYGIDEEWEKQVYKYCSQLMVIDDLADRKHFCDYLLDQTFMREKRDYIELVPIHCQLMLGTSFALLRSEFSLSSSFVKEVRERVECLDAPKILIMMGGTDHLNISEKVLTILLNTSKFSEISIVLGPTAPHYTNLLKYSDRDERIQVLSDISNVVELMLEHDICFGAAGSASWERCAVGLPSILVAFASNQVKILSMMREYGAAYTFELSTESSISQSLNQIQESHNYHKMVDRCIEVCDGQGIHRVLKKLNYARN